MLDFIVRNWEAIAISVVILIVGTILNLLLRKRTKISLKYLMSTNNLIKGKDDSDIKVTFKGIDAPNVTVTKIAIWNNGNQRLNKIEITKKYPVTISVDSEYKILDILILKQSNENSEFFVPKQVNENSEHDSSDISPSSYVIDFEYINPKQGCVIQIVHTAPNENSISLHCELKNGKKIIKELKNEEDKKNETWLIYMFTLLAKRRTKLLFSLGIAFTIAGILNLVPISYTYDTLGLKVVREPDTASALLFLFSGILTLTYSALNVAISPPGDLENELYQRNIKIK